MLSELRFSIEKLIRQFEILNLESKVSYRGRLAPSPTGYLHTGHALTFWRAQERCRTQHGTLVLRVEDLDRDRCRNTAKPFWRTSDGLACNGTKVPSYKANVARSTSKLGNICVTRALSIPAIVRGAMS